MTAPKPAKDHARNAVRSPLQLDDEATLASVDRVIRRNRMKLTVTQDDDGFLVTIVQRGRRYLGLHSSLTEAFRDALDDAGTL